MLAFLLCYFSLVIAIHIEWVISESTPFKWDHIVSPSKVRLMKKTLKTNLVRVQEG